MASTTDYPDPDDEGAATPLPEGGRGPVLIGGASVAIELTEEEVKALAEAVAEAERQKAEVLQSLVRQLHIKCDTVVKAKRPIEQRWIDDTRQYDGQARMANSKQYSSDTNARADNAEPPRLHLTRARTDLWEARLADMIFPANDQSWEIDLPSDYCPNTGNPELDDQIRNGAGMARDAMSEVINAQLKNCKFIRSGRRAIRDACRIGTGLLMGPMNGIKIDRRFRQQPGPGGAAMSVEIQETEVPEIREGDPWCFYPDMVPSPEKAEFAFYLHLMSEREVQELAQYPGFDEEQIRQLLKKEPVLGEVGNSLRMRNERMSTQEELKGRYGVWRYTGTITRKEFEALSLDCECDELTPLPFVDIWFSQDCILKASMQKIDKDYRIPYFVFSPFPADDSMFGYSLPYYCRDSQRVADAAYQITLLNSSVSSGPIIVARRGKIEPADGKYEIRGPKWLWVTDPEVELANAFTVTEITNTADQAMAVLKLAIQFIDMELNAEQWASPDPNETTTQTASGLAMLINAKSILQRRAASCADDEIFSPIIERMIWWNLMYNERQDIRGEYQVIPKAQTVQLVKDIQAQHLQAFMALAKDPYFAGMANPYGLFKAFTAMLDVPRDELMVDEDEWKASQANQPPDPNMALIQAKSNQANATAENLHAEAELAETKAGVEHDAHAMHAMGRDLDHQEFQMEQQTRQRESDARLMAAKLQADAKNQATQTHAGVEQQKAAAGVHDTNTKSSTELTKAGMDARTTAAELAIKQQTGSGI